MCRGLVFAPEAISGFANHFSPAQFLDNAFARELDSICTETQTLSLSSAYVKIRRSILNHDNQPKWVLYLPTFETFGYVERKDGSGPNDTICWSLLLRVMVLHLNANATKLGSWELSKT